MCQIQRAVIGTFDFLKFFGKVIFQGLTLLGRKRVADIKIFEVFSAFSDHIQKMDAVMKDMVVA